MYCLCHYDFGSIKRSEYANRTPFGYEIKQMYIDNDLLWTDEEKYNRERTQAEEDIRFFVFNHFMSTNECPNGLILDHFPQDLSQAERLAPVLE